MGAEIDGFAAIGAAVVDKRLMLLDAHCADGERAVAQCVLSSSRDGYEVRREPTDKSNRRDVVSVGR